MKLGGAKLAEWAAAAKSNVPSCRPQEAQKAEAALHHQSEQKQELPCGGPLDVDFPALLAAPAAAAGPARHLCQEYQRVCFDQASPDAVKSKSQLHNVEIMC